MNRIESRLNQFLSTIEQDTRPYDNPLEAYYKTKQIKQRRKRIYTCELTDGSHPAYIIPLGDVHLGSYSCNLELFKAVLDLILRTPHCYTVLIGDMAETATRESVGNAMFDEVVHIPDQINMLHALLKPLAEAGKILGVLTGNHENRVQRLTGLNPMQILADKLDVNYLGYQGYIYAQVGDIGYRIMCHHGIGKGTTTAAKVAAVERLNRIAQADIYIAGHTHDLIHHNDIIMTFGDDGEIVPQKRHYIVAGSFLDYWDGYPECGLLAPSECGVARIELMNNTKEVRVIA